MHTFTDSEKREWRLSLNFATLERLRDAGVDLTDPQTVTRLGDDPFKLGKTLWALVEGQAAEADISPEIFAAGMADGEAIESAVGALVEELLLFTRPARRPALTKAMEAKRRLETATMRALEEEIDGGALDRQVEQAIGKLRAEWRSTS